MNVTPSTVSLERLVPNALDGADATGRETLALHMARYRFAAGFVKGGRVLDCACGVGYGTAMLAGAEQTPEQVLGVDIDAAAVAYAARSYASERIGFLDSDGCELEDSLGFDTIVSLETVEHVPSRRAPSEFPAIAPPRRYADRIGPSYAFSRRESLPSP